MANEFGDLKAAGGQAQGIKEPVPEPILTSTSPRGASPGVTTRIIRDTKYGHLVEVYDLPEQTPGLEPPAGRRAAERAGTTRPDSVQSP